MCGERYYYVVRYGGQTMVRAADCPGVARNAGIEPALNHYAMIILFLLLPLRADLVLILTRLIVCENIF